MAKRIKSLKLRVCAHAAFAFILLLQTQASRAATLDCNELQAPGTSAEAVYEHLLFAPASALVQSCLALMSTGQASPSVQNAVSIRLSIDGNLLSEAQTLAQLSAWLATPADPVALESLALAFGTACGPSACLLNEPDYSTLRDRLVTSTSRGSWVLYRSQNSQMPNFQFDHALKASVFSLNTFENTLSTAGDLLALDAFNRTPTADNVELLLVRINRLITDIERESQVLNAKTNKVDSDLAPIGRHLLVLKSMIDSGSYHAAKQDLRLLAVDGSSSDLKKSDWKRVTSSVFPIYWQIMQELEDQKFQSAPGLKSEVFASIMAQTLISDPILAASPSQALASLRFDRYPYVTGGRRLNDYLADWTTSIQSKICAAKDPNCQTADSDLIVIASRPGPAQANANDLENLKNTLFSNEGDGYLALYDLMIDYLNDTDAFHCADSKVALHNPCLPLGLLIGKATQPLMTAIEDRYAKLRSGEVAPTAHPPLALLHLVNNYEFSHSLAFAEGLGDYANSLTYKFMVVATENLEHNLSQDLALGHFTLSGSDEASLLHVSVCKRAQSEANWLPDMSSAISPADQRKIDRLTANQFALNRLLSLHESYDAYGPLPLEAAGNKDRLNREFVDLLSRPVVYQECPGSDALSAAVYDIYRPLSDETQNFIFSDKTFMNRDLSDFSLRSDDDRGI